MKKLRKIIQVDKKELNHALREYEAKDEKNTKKHEKIFTAFDLFLDRCLSISLQKKQCNR